MKTLIMLFLAFAKIGFLGFGGGMAMLPLIYESSLQFQNISEEAFANLFAISQATPGPIAVNAATFVGFESSGFIGAISATLGVSIPSFILVIAVMRAVDRFNESSLVKGAFTGIRPATVGLIASAFVMIGKTAVMKTGFAFDQVSGIAELLDGINIFALAACAATIVLSVFFRKSPVFLMVLMGCAGAAAAHIGII